MNRLVFAVVVVFAFQSIVEAQDLQPGTLPLGPAPGPTDLTWLVNALFVQANMIEGREVMFMVPLDEPDPAKLPPPPSVSVKIDGKAIRAFDVDRQRLDIRELNERLSLRAAAVVVHGQAPDPFFLKALHERTVIFVVPKKLFNQLAKAASGESLQGWWTVKKPDAKSPTLTDDHWIIGEQKITFHADGKLVGSMTYKISAEDYPRRIDLTPEYGPGKGKTLRGIYDLDGNRLTICYVSPTTENPAQAERPAEFGANETVTVNFERLQP